MRCMKALGKNKQLTISVPFVLTLLALVILYFAGRYAVRNHIFSIAISAITHTKCEYCSKSDKGLEDIFGEDYAEEEPEDEDVADDIERPKYYLPASIPSYFYEIDKK